MTKKQAWVKALRLRTLPLSLSGILFGSFLAMKSGNWDALIFSLAFITTVLFQIVSNLANDLGDSQKGADNENRVGPQRSVQSGLITMKEMKNAVIGTSILSLLFATALVVYGTQGMSIEVLWFYFGLAGFCVLAAITYTMGKKAYGYNGLGDVFVFIFFGLVSVIGVYCLYAKGIDFIVILPAMVIGLLSTAVLNLNNMRDIENDASVGKRTIVVKMGSLKAKYYHYFLILGSTVSLAFFHALIGSTIGWFGMLPCLLLLKHLMLVKNVKDPKDFDPELKKIALLTFFIAILNGVLINL